MVVALVVLAGATPGSAATPAACHVRNTGTDKAYATLQAAVDAAKRGSRLVVKGTCRGGTLIDKDLVVEGVMTPRTGRPVLDGARHRWLPDPGSTRVLIIKSGVTVSIRSLLIRNGRASRILDGGGITNKGTTTIVDVVVRSSQATGRGGGIFNAGILHMRGASRVRGNAAPTGPGVYNAGRLVMGDTARIRGNDCSGLHNVGVVVMNDTSNLGDNAHGWPFCARGNSNDGTFVMNDASSIFGDYGGMVNSGTFTMNDTSSIHANWGRAGVRNAGTFRMNDHSSIHHIRGDSLPRMVGDGGEGGVANAGTFIMNDKSSVHHNTGDGRGGGVWNGPAAGFTMNGSSRVHDNHLVDRTNGHGGGLYNSSGGTLIGIDCGVSVNHNAPDDCFLEP
jgi:hypothetical protein